MQNVGQPYDVLDMPWLRARQELRLQRIDGYYTAILLNEMSPFGQLSAPLYLENWYWFVAPSAQRLPKEMRQYGVVRGSHQAKWFESLGITPTVEVNTAEELLLVLKRKRIDTVLMDLETFAEIAERVELTTEAYSSDFFRYVPLGVYFSSRYLQEKPDFLAAFNHNIPLCTQTPFALSEREKVQIKNQLFIAAEQLSQDPRLVSAVQEANSQPSSEEQLTLLDKQWADELALNISGLAVSMQQSPLSKYLHTWQQQFSGQVAEIMLMDQQGRNVAISEITSDYWQGDEAKFQQAVQALQPYYFDAVSFDASTQRFLVHLSIPLYEIKTDDKTAGNKERGNKETADNTINSNTRDANATPAIPATPIGMLILGIDVELSLQQCAQSLSALDCS
ncbi:hypothetical protein GCM10008111_03470 [Alishewanella tabrizica]|uniref:Uncharacterized protein n=2 Tax=Alishewanella tabrizica TaxID=671278 RepID=A0ABQ2WD87_9ALTE|nr:hypothetical protein GCM10008111_03470 [Alishewanella tabrizica]